jgi:IS1 family transposase/transposase-like protein
MIQIACNHQHTQKHGKDTYGNQRRKCMLCGKTWIEKAPQALGAMRIEKSKAVLALKLMLEGSSLRTINRLTGLNRHTLASLLLLIGKRCHRFLNTKIRGVQTSDIQVDELWAFIGCKEKYRMAMGRSEELGDSYTYLAIDRTSKLILTHQIGKRDSSNTRLFVSKLREAFAGNCHVTSDGFSPYTHSLPVALWDKNITFAQLIKVFSKQTPREEARYSPAPISNIIKKKVWGDCEDSQISTSHVERLNLSVRMGMRRFTRLTNAHSKSWRYHAAAVALWICYYNYCRPHMTLKTTPAVKAGLTDSVWSVDRLLDELAVHA